MPAVRIANSASSPAAPDLAEVPLLRADEENLLQPAEMVREKALEPAPRKLRDPFERAPLLEQVRRAGDDLELDGLRLRHRRAA